MLREIFISGGTRHLGKGSATGVGLWTNQTIAQLVKNPPAMQETPVQFLSWEDLLEKG